MLLSFLSFFFVPCTVFHCTTLKCRRKSKRSWWPNFIRFAQYRVSRHPTTRGIKRILKIINFVQIGASFPLRPQNCVENIVGRTYTPLDLNFTTAKNQTVSSFNIECCVRVFIKKKKLKKKPKE